MRGLSRDLRWLLQVCFRRGFAGRYCSIWFPIRASWLIVVPTPALESGELDCPGAEPLGGSGTISDALVDASRDDPIAEILIGYWDELNCRRMYETQRASRIGSDARLIAGAC